MFSKLLVSDWILLSWFDSDPTYANITRPVRTGARPSSTVLSPAYPAIEKPRHPRSGLAFHGVRLQPGQRLTHLGNDIEARSEERRVGKECRSRWSPYH